MSQTRCSLCKSAIAEYGVCPDCTDKLEKLSMEQRLAIMGGCQFPACGPTCRMDCPERAPKTAPRKIEILVILEAANHCWVGEEADRRGRSTSQIVNEALNDVRLIQERCIQEVPTDDTDSKNVPGLTLEALERMAAAVELLSENFARIVEGGGCVEVRANVVPR